jgi:predicted flap endonuclease-1-like 5' DNA nuclease
MYAALKPDNLQVVEGIGPKMNEVLKKHGVHTWAELGSSNFDALRGILDKENPKRYRIIDPTTWPAQAKLANDGEWDKLIAMQKQLDTGRSGVSDHETDSKVEKMLIKLGVLKRWKQDDLKAVEGIGPKIEGLLKADGIDTWRKLSNAQVSTIQDILTKAGKRYKLADPTTWPKQAGMCADGKWDELETYQDQLNGGK